MARGKKFIEQRTRTLDDDTRLEIDTNEILCRLMKQQWERQLEPLDIPDIICLLLSKLPNVLVDRWNRRVFNMRRNSTMESSLSNLILFIDEETTLLIDLLFSRDAVSQSHEKKEKSDQKKKVNTLLAKTEIQTNESFKLKAQKEEIECPMSGKEHGIEDCGDFLKLSIKEGSRMIFLKKIVMGVAKRSQECIMQKIASTEKCVRCVVASIQQHCIDWF